MSVLTRSSVKASRSAAGGKHLQDRAEQVQIGSAADKVLKDTTATAPGLVARRPSYINCDMLVLCSRAHGAVERPAMYYGRRMEAMPCITWPGRLSSAPPFPRSRIK